MSKHLRSKPPLETDIKLNFHGQMTYEDYLYLNQVLSAQKPLSDPPHHDELLFIIQHQTSELWMKLILHELRAAITHIQQDTLNPCFKILARVKQIQRQLFEQWAVLETLTPNEYAKFRKVLANASGLQSIQYRSIEFILGNKNSDLVELYRHNDQLYQEITRILQSPSLYDEFLLYLSRHSYQVPKACITRNWAEPHTRNTQLISVFKHIYDHPKANWDAYEMCEKLVDVEENFHLWRFRHLKTVERIIGYKPGTGGSSGVAYLKQSLELTFFPELFDVRTEIWR